MDRIIGTHFYTGTITQTSKSTGSGVQSCQCCCTAVLDSHIITFCRSMLTITGTFNLCGLSLGCFCFHAHNSTDLSYRICGTDRTGIDRCIPCCNRCCYCITACITTGTAVVSRETLSDCNGFLIHCHIKFLSCSYQCNADNKTDHTDHYSRNDNFLHILIPLLQTTKAHECN